MLVKKTVLYFIQNTLRYDVVPQRIATPSYFRVFCMTSHRNSCLHNTSVISTPQNGHHSILFQGASNGHRINFLHNTSKRVTINHIYVQLNAFWYWMVLPEMLAVLINHANNQSMQLLCNLKSSSLQFKGTIQQTHLIYSEFCTFVGTHLLMRCSEST